MASSVCRAWTVAASIGAVEALKDQVGFCRWNYTIRSIHQHAKNRLNNKTTTKIPPSSSSSSPILITSSTDYTDYYNRNIQEKATPSEESLRKVMFLSCWGPN